MIKLGYEKDGNTIEEPFAQTLKFYKEVVDFLSQSKKILDKFIHAIPKDEDKHELYFWNDTAKYPSIRFELHVKRDVIPGKTDWESITYKVTKKINNEYIVNIRGKGHIFDNEERALLFITECYHAIRNYDELP